MKKTTNPNFSKRKYNRRPPRTNNDNRNNDAIIIRNRDNKNQLIKDAIFAFTGGKKSLLIKGEGNEISTAVEVAEIIKNRMYPSIEVANISLGSRPFFQKNNSKNNKSDIVSKIEILLKTT